MVFQVHTWKLYQSESTGMVSKRAARSEESDLGSDEVGEEKRKGSVGRPEETTVD